MHRSQRRTRQTLWICWRRQSVNQRYRQQRDTRAPRVRRRRLNSTPRHCDRSPPWSFVRGNIVRRGRAVVRFRPRAFAVLQANSLPTPPTFGPADLLGGICHSANTTGRSTACVERSAWWSRFRPLVVGAGDNVRVVRRLLRHATAAMMLDRCGHPGDDLAGVADAVSKAIESIAVSQRYPPPEKIARAGRKDF